MASIDYGAIYRINGNFINKNKDLFTEAPEFVPDTVMYKGEEIDIAGNYYVYLGDKDCFLVFYKGNFGIIEGNKMTFMDHNMPFISYTYLNPSPSIDRLKVSRLDPEYQYEYYSWGRWSDYVQEHWMNEEGETPTGNEPLNTLADGKNEWKRFLKHAKKIAWQKQHKKGVKYRPFRFMAEWDYMDDHYEVIFGYGIDPSPELWKNASFRKTYGFTKREVEIIDSWFNFES